MESDRHKYYPAASAYVMFPKKIDFFRPTSDCGDQNTYTIKLGSNAAVSVSAFATLSDMIEFAHALEKFVHREQEYLDRMSQDDGAEGAGC